MDSDRAWQKLARSVGCCVMEVCVDCGAAIMTDNNGSFGG
ncbi:uncharacterized protein G2W53_014624 [Senna tora]|uniref:Uncharacterized protein n=1 Tax=Senna tora TaxID=362788 RepID=A0A835C6Q2_9FABA|nr:uncharacterized protein G2W53_014624 [Senna tora]